MRTLYIIAVILIALLHCAFQPVDFTEKPTAYQLELLTMLDTCEDNCSAILNVYKRTLK